MPLLPCRCQGLNDRVGQAAMAEGNDLLVPDEALNDQLGHLPACRVYATPIRPYSDTVEMRQSLCTASYTRT